MSETGRVAPGCGPTDPDGVQPPEGRDVIALPVTAPLPVKPCTCRHPASKHAFGCWAGWLRSCKCEGGQVDWELMRAMRAHGMDPETRRRTAALLKTIDLPVGRRRAEWT